MLRIQQMDALPNTLGLPCVADQTVCITDLAQLPALGTLWQQSPRCPFILGCGSNVVLPPRVHHLVVLPHLRGITLIDSTPDAWVVQAMAGESWHDLVAHTLVQGWPGLENLALIPGTVGAAPVQNIGAYGIELRARLHSVLAWHCHDGKLHELSNEACQFAYRDSRFKREKTWLIVAVRLRLPRPWQPVLTYPDIHQALQAVPHVDAHAIFEAVCTIRRAKLPDPAILANAGSYFKNPVVDATQAAQLHEAHPDLPTYPQPDGRVKLAAGWLIQAAGWKGRRLGPVGMHARQALVLVNHGKACFDDVIALQKAVRDAVRTRFGIQLEREPVLLTDDDVLPRIKVGGPV